MTELAVREEAPAHEYTGALVAWAAEARAAASIAVSLAKTAFVPASLRDDNHDVTAAQITAAILAGQELGMSPMSALRSIDIIEGAPALRAVAMRALVQSKGHEIWPGPTSAERVVMYGRRHGEDHVVEREWTIAKARSMGITTTRSGGTKKNWQGQPENMLIARATSEVCRLIAADVILGMPYSAEELQDGVDKGEPEDQPRRRTVRRKPVEPAAPVEEPTFDEPAADAEPVEDWPEVTPIPEPEA